MLTSFYFQRCSLIGVVSLIAFGLFLFTYHYTEFHAFGFGLIMIASFLSGLRWTITQLITQKHELGKVKNENVFFESHVQ